MLTNDRRFARNAQTRLDGEKFCSACRKWHPVADFPRSSIQSSGLSSWCRECHREAVRDWRRRNRERENARRREAYRRDMPKCGDRMPAAAAAATSQVGTSPHLPKSP